MCLENCVCSSSKIITRGTDLFTFFGVSVCDRHGLQRECILGADSALTNVAVVVCKSLVQLDEALTPPTCVVSTYISPFIGFSVEI